MDNLKSVAGSHVDLDQKIAGIQDTETANSSLLVHRFVLGIIVASIHLAIPS